MSLVTSNGYSSLLMFEGSYDYWTEHDCCDAWIEHVFIWNSVTNTLIKWRRWEWTYIEEDRNKRIMCLEVTTTLQFIVTFCHIGILCYWVFAGCGDLSNGEESLGESMVNYTKKVAKKISS